MNEKNEPLMFIETIQYIQTKDANSNFKKSSKSNLNEIKGKVLKLVRFYEKSRKIIVEIKTSVNKYKGTLFNFKDDIVYFKEKDNVHHFKLDEILDIKIIEV